jgi:hypothetical protein
MGRNSNALKSEQLGMSHSTAAHQLRKLLMFQLVQQSGRDLCFQCGEKIESAENMSIEHKKPWLHSEDPKAMFFDLDNIAFSHTKCNYGSARKVISKVTRKATSGFKGVHSNNDPKSPFKYRSDIRVDGKRHFVGYFNDPVECAEAYDKKLIELRGEQAVTNKSLGLL